MDLRDRFRGVLLGTALGDALGLPFEGARPGPTLSAAVQRQLSARTALGYSDDTEMMLGVAESLVERSEFEPEHMLRTIAANFEPARGYGHGMRRVLEAVRDGAIPWDEAARSVWPDGSMGNGAAARVGPIACAFHKNSDLTRLAAESARISHQHPIGAAGAVAMATAIAATFRGEGALVALDVEHLNDRLAVARALDADDPRTVAEALGNGTTADTSVVTAIYWADRLRSPAAIARAIETGGDTDTIAAMTGALVGARLGASALPQEWVARLEDGFRGRSHILALADRLVERFGA